MRIYYIFLFTIISNSIFGQVISGVIVNEKDEPFDGVNIYFDGTTIATITNTEGRFSLPNSIVTNGLLIISYIGYETLFFGSKDLTSDLKVKLKPIVNQLKTVTIDGNRKKYLEVFKEQFLGNSENARLATIRNEFDLDFSYDLNTNILTASAEKPLLIINKALGYKIYYQLVDFQVKFSSKEINNMQVSNVIFLGVSRYTAYNNTMEVKKRRKDCYHGSNLHFFRNLVSNNLEENNFKLYSYNQRLNPKDIFTVSDTLNYKKVYLKLKTTMDDFRGNSQLLITYNNIKKSWITFDTPVFYVDLNGVNSNVNEIIIGGEMGKIRFADMVPKNYYENE